MQAGRQMRADLRVGVVDPGQRPADRLADGDPGAFVLAGEAPDPAAQPGSARELGDQPTLFGTRAIGPLSLASKLQLVDLRPELRQPAPVATDARVVQHRLPRR